MKSLQVLFNTGETVVHFRLHVIEYSPCNNCWPDEPVKSSFIASRSLDMLKKFHCLDCNSCVPKLDFFPTVQSADAIFEFCIYLLFSKRIFLY